MMAECFAPFLSNARKEGFSLKGVSVDLLNELLYSEEEINRLAIVGLRRLFEFLWESERIHWDLAEELLIELRIF